MTQTPEIKKIRDKWISQPWPKFVNTLAISGLHTFKEQQIDFKFPVCAIVGENGTGKSTILKMLACSYKDPVREKTLYPSDFFPETAWDSPKDIKVSYYIKQGEKLLIKKITKPAHRWLGITERPENSVFYFDINRIQSIETVIGYAKLAKKTIKEIASRHLSVESIEKISEIMARQYLGGRYAKTSADSSREIGILKFNFGDISKFHQGTGESIVFDMIASIEKIPDYSLVVIDEIESSLHPKAQRRLIRQLLNLARVKTLQIVFSTHSPYILSELPPEARILLTRVNGGSGIIYAPTVEFCLSQIDDHIYSELDILVEDTEAKCLVSELIRNYKPEILSRVRILPVGTADVIRMLEDLYQKGKMPIKILGIVDADQPNMAPALKLPGQFSPEKQIIMDICKTNMFSKFSSILNVDEQSIKKEFEEIQTVLNYNEWVDRLSQKFNIFPQTFWSYMVLVWIRNCLPENQAKEVIETIDNRLNRAP